MKTGRGRKPTKEGNQSVRIAVAIHPKVEGEELVNFWNELVAAYENHDNSQYDYDYAPQRLAIAYLLRVAYHYHSNGVIVPGIEASRELKMITYQIGKVKTELLETLQKLKDAAKNGDISMPEKQEDIFSQASVRISGMLEFDFAEDDDDSEEKDN